MLFNGYSSFKTAATKKVSNFLQHKSVLILLLFYFYYYCFVGIYLSGKLWNVIQSHSSEHCCRIFAVSPGDHNHWKLQMKMMMIGNIQTPENSACFQTFPWKKTTEKWFLVCNTQAHNVELCVFINAYIFINLQVFISISILYIALFDSIFIYFYHTKDHVLSR